MYYNTPILARQERRVILFSELLTQLRKESGMTQVQVAHACDISIRQYQRFEGDEQKPGFDHLSTLANYFNVSVDYLMGRSAKREVTDPLPRPAETESLSEK